jgi:phosphotriesterase-related protein
MNRRTFAKLLAVGTGSLLATQAGEAKGGIETVKGRIPAHLLGVTLPHEHVLVDFVGADRVGPDRYERDKVVAFARPHLRQARALGVRSVFECTPAYLARDPRVLVRLADETGLHLVTNTGLYGVRQNRFLPPYAFTESARELAGRWIREALEGIDGTGVKPGFIKSGVDVDPELSPLHRKLVEAAALTHAETGLTIAVHTGRGPGLAQLDLLAANGVAPEAWIWVHAQGAADAALLTAARRGAWISCDGLNPSSIPRHLHLCQLFRREGLLHRVLLSHDAGWYDPDKPGGGTFRPYDLLFTVFLPALRANGFAESEIATLTVGNPAAAFAVRRRPV